jgi:protein TonB
MNTDTSDHEPKAKPAATPARFASRRRHPGPVQATDTAPGSSTTPLRVHATSPSGDLATTGYTFRTWNRLHARNRRIHFAIAIAISVAAHVGLVLSGEGSKKVAVASTQAARAVEIVTFDMPPPEETPVEVEDSEQSDTPPAEFAPPMQADLPSLVTVDSFVQPLQPPVPSGISTDMDMMAVPKTVAIGTGNAAPKLFEIAELDRVPNRIRTGLLNYPQEFRRSRKEGDVHLLVVIDPTGHVRVAKVLESTHPEFTRAAVAAAEQSVYEAPRKGGAAVSAQYTLRVPFRLTTDG